MIKPHVFSAVMDFFSTGLPVLTDEQPSPDTCELFYYMICWFVCFVALRPKSTAMVMAGRSVHLTTLFPGQA